jgi:tyrosine-protein kinase Etk/Wzc
MVKEEYKPRLPVAEPTFLQSMLRYVAVCLKYKYLIGGITGVAAAAAVGVCVLSTKLPPGKNPLPNQYTATATILIQQSSSSDLTANILSAISGAGDQQSAAPLGFEYSSLVLRMLQSRVILDQIVQEFDIPHKFKLDPEAKSQARTMLLGRARFSYTRLTGTIAITFRDTDPVFARDVVNRMVVLLDGWFTQIWGMSSQKQRDLLEQKIGEVNKQVVALETELKALQKKYGFLNSQDLAASQAAALTDLRSQLILKEIEIKNYSTYATQQDPHLQQLDMERQNILDLITQVQQGIANSEQPDTSAASNQPDATQQYARLSQELDVQRGIYSTLSHQDEMAKLAIQPLPVFQVLEMAETPDHKSGPSRTSIIAMTTIIAFFSSLVLAFAIHGIQKIRKDPQLRTLLKDPR